MKHNKLLISLLAVSVLILAALILNLLQGGLWVVSGLNGKSAYQLAVENGFQGSLQEWLASLEGSDGSNGTNGTNGTNGKSAYEIAVENGFRGSLQEWLLSLKFGKDGQNGKDGQDGDRGADGQNGKDGSDGVGISSLYINENGHLIAVLTDGSLIDAGEVGSLLPSDSSAPSDYATAVREGYIGTLHQWLLTFLDTATDIRRSGEGELLLTLKDGSVKNAGKLPANGFISDTVDAEGFRPRFEYVVMNREATGLNLRAAPDVSASTPIVTAIVSGKELICIGSATVNGEEFYRFSHNGTVCYAKSKYFEKKYDDTAGSRGIAIPNRLVLTEGVPFRLVRQELIPWADERYALEYRYSGRGATWATDSESSLLTAPLSDTAEILNVTLWRAVEEGMLRVCSIDVEITVIPRRELPALNGLFIGDSRFARGDLLAQLLRMTPSLESIGTLENTSGIPCEGRGGWKAENFWISSGVGDLSNPFYDTETKSFSFSHYMEELLKVAPDTTVDFVVFYLGTNDGYTVRSVDAIRGMVQSIHSYDPTIPVLILTEYQSPARELPYSADLTRRGQFRYFQRLYDAFGEKDAQKVYLIPTHICVDTFEDRILSADETGNPIISDYVHLGSLGYQRQATVLSTYLSWIFGA